MKKDSIYKTLENEKWGKKDQAKEEKMPNWKHEKFPKEDKFKTPK